MADAMDILNIRDNMAQRPSEAAQLITGSHTKPKEKKQREKKPEGFSRELYSLIGGMPSVVPVDHGFKEKPNLGLVRAVEWKWAPFTNPARSDGMVLHHWVKDIDVDQEYTFAKFNKKSEIVRFTDGEYESFFQDPNWTREETEELFNLCERFDLRFPVILDRFESQTEKTMEDIKDRYYKIMKKLIEIRNNPNDSGDHNYTAELAKFDYDKEREIQRKAQLELLHNRTVEQVKEEEILLIEARKIEQNSKKLLKDRQHVIKLLNNIDAAFPTKKTSQKRGHESLANPMKAATAEVIEPLKKKKRLSKGPSEENQLPSPPISASTSGLLHAMSPDIDAQKKKEKIPAGPYVRSSRLTAPLQVGTKMAKRIDQFFEELGIPARPSMPSAGLCQTFDDIRYDIVNLLELKKLVDKKEHDIKVLENRKIALEEALGNKKGKN